MNAPATVLAGGTAPPAPVTAPRQSQNRFGARWLLYLKALLGTPSQRRLAWAGLQIDRIRHWEKEWHKHSDQEMAAHALQLKGRARGGESLDTLLPEIFGMASVACQRAHKLRPYDVQLAAGVVLHRGALAEVATGEGKTLIAVLPVALHAMTGRGIHVTTVNDYLARRDGEWTSAIYHQMGLTVGILQQKLPDDQRTEAYRSDITYGTASEFGFDFLRDRLKVAMDKGQVMPFWAPWTAPDGTFSKPVDPKVQRDEHYYALVDEADNIFIDEARTPLIISGPTREANEEEQVVYHWADDLARKMQPLDHFTLDQKKQKIELTEEGKRIARFSNPPFGKHSHAMDKLHEHMERALHAHFRFRLDQHYLIEKGKVVIIDESTGRRMPDRHWREGLHQAVEAKERVTINMPSDHAAQITFQSYFRLYKKLAGMSGTAAQNFWEVRKVYKLWVVCVPTNQPVIRENRPDRVYPTEDTKFRVIVDEVRRMRDKGRPVLVGTRSVEKSEKLSKLLVEAGINHQVLNARPEIADKEADVVAQAGRPGTITIATNMAGRGTDIILGGNAETIAWTHLRKKYAHRHDVPIEEWRRTVEEIEARQNLRELHEQVVQAGGLHVIGTERHEAIRIDRQLAGRAGRQGDPGSAQFFLSLEDELLEGLGPRRQEALKQVGRKYADDVSNSWQKHLSAFHRAQRRIERRHYRQRVDLVIYEKNRQEILKDLGADPYVD
jgi:preprotein translocase subunit SecA